MTSPVRKKRYHEQARKQRIHQAAVEERIKLIKVVEVHKVEDSLDDELEVVEVQESESEEIPNNRPADPPVARRVYARRTPRRNLLED